jgi:probable rRNA maturation factor
MVLTVRKTAPQRLPRQRLLALGEKLLRSEGWPADVCEVDLWLCTDAEIRELNRQYRGRDEATDVLSFPQYAPGERPTPGLPVALGDIVISVDTATRQATARGASAATEIVWLFLHSLLHLLGYDDDTHDRLAVMVAKAEAVLRGV